MNIPGEQKKPLKDNEMIPLGRYLFSVHTASQVDAGRYGEHIVLTLRIERGIYEGRLVRFFKSVLTWTNFDEQDNEIRFLNYPHESDGGMLVMTFPEWNGTMFYADLVYESINSQKPKHFLKNINRVITKTAKRKG